MMMEITFLFLSFLLSFFYLFFVQSFTWVFVKKGDLGSIP